MPAIRNALTDILNTTSWSFPAEDANKTNYQGTLHTIGLSSSAYGNEMAQSLYLLRSKLGDEMKKNILSSLYRKVFNPTLQALRNNNANKEFTWLTSSGNHNSVTLSNVTSAALSVIQDKNERAVFLAIAERYSNNSLVGFTEDGYCSEGVGYYTYGFGHYILLRENIWQASGGKIDLFARPKIDRVVRFVPGMEIINGVYAAIGDCEPNIQPGKQVMYYLNKNFNLGFKNYDEVLIDDIDQPTLANIMYFFPNSSSLAAPVTTNIKKEIRHYFNIAGVLTVRPSTTKGFDMGATFKGGNNNEHHNHNDVGSYSIAMGEKIVMGDPGLGIYTPTYFGPDRYTYKTTSSYGHPVPIVAGVQQSEGKNAQAIIIDTNFTDNKDVFSMDISSAYNVPALKKLVRTFTYERSDEGFTEVKDDISFSSPQTYESALITRANWKQLAKNIIEFTGPTGKMIAEIISPVAFSISSEEIKEAKEPYTRIAIRLDKPITSGTFSIVFRPQKNIPKTKKNN